MIKISKVIALLVASIYLFSNCKGKVQQPQPSENENEIFTTLILKLKDSSDQNQIKEFIFRDLNQNDAIDGTYTVPSLDAFKTYLGEVLVLDETKTPTDTISKEIINEGVDHQFQFITNSPNLKALYTNSDIDSKGYLLGIHPKIVTKEKSTSNTFRIILYHLPNIKSNNLEQNKQNGSIDIDKTFYDIQIK